VEMMRNHRGINGWFVATNINVMCKWRVHSENLTKFERPKLFSVENSKEFGIGYCKKFGRQKIHISKKKSEFA
jgi:hypothetical protein